MSAILAARYEDEHASKVGAMRCGRIQLAESELIEGSLCQCRYSSAKGKTQEQRGRETSRRSNDE
jgi:hypothetical protein